MNEGQSAPHEAQRRSWGVTVIGVGLIVVLLVAFLPNWFGNGDEGSSVAQMQIEKVILSWVSQDAGRGPLVVPGQREIKATTLAPSKRRQHDSSPLPCLDMGPESQLNLTVQPDHADASLRLAVGFDREDYEGTVEGSVRFTVRSRDVVLFEVTKPYGRSVPMGEQIWTRAPLLPLKDLDTLTLSTERITGDGPVHAAFAQLEVLRTVDRPRTRASQAQPNIVFLVIDTLRADRLTCYGLEKPTSPHMDALAARGTRFANGWAPSPWTWPSTASLLTGLSPAEHGLLSYEACYLAQEFETLPERLQAAGWTTAAFSANPLVHPDKDFDQGFESFETYSWARGATLAADVNQWIDSVAEYRFFAYVHLTDPHQYEPDERFQHLIEGEFNGARDGAELRRLFGERLQGRESDPAPIQALAQLALSIYDATVAESDAAIGAIVEHIAELGLTQRTLFVLTSDHGEEFLEHGMLYHGNQLHRELMAVPLILAGPGVPAGKVITERAENRFLFDTIVTRWIDPEANIEGTDLLNPSALSAAATRPLFSTTSLGIVQEPGQGFSPNRNMHAVRTQTDLLIWAPPAAASRPGREPLPEAHWYFDLTADPNAQSPIPLGPGSPHSQRAASLQDSIARWLAHGLTRQPALLGGGSSTRDALDAMGYTK